MIEEAERSSSAMADRRQLFAEMRKCHNGFSFQLTPALDGKKQTATMFHIWMQVHKVIKYFFNVFESP